MPYMNKSFSRLPVRLALTAAVLTAGLGYVPAAHAQRATKKYQVAQLQPGLPPEAVNALKKAALPAPPLNTPLPKNPKVVFQTSKGAITFALDAKAAPLHVRSFLYLVRKGFYNKTVFHRYADLTGDGGYIIQGGDPLTKSPATKQFAGIGGPGYEVPLEISKLKHDKFALAAARSQDPNSAGSQFYICQAPVHFLDGNYTVFGKVVGGQSAALKLREGDVIKSATVVK
jgi:cyclophilin family peptidyl-prolyl cis-trans isomerase